MGSLTEPKIPVIDFSKEDLKPGTQAWLSTSKQAWSNRIRPCVHRVFMNVNDERYTLELFEFQKEEISVPDELVDDEQPLKYKPFNHLDYEMTLLKQIYDSNTKTDYPIEAYCVI
ncbi:hypothetical protein ACOSP7_020720 [Xanthoceras sorbifolium]